MHVVQLYTYVQLYLYVYYQHFHSCTHNTYLYLVWYIHIYIEINWDLCDGSRLSGFMLFALPDCISQYIFLNIQSANIKIPFSHLIHSRNMFQKIVWEIQDTRELYMKISYKVISVYLYIQIYNPHYIIPIYLQTSKTATFLLIYSCNLSGLGEPLQSRCVYAFCIVYTQHMRPKSLKNWLGFHEKDFSDNLKIVSVHLTEFGLLRWKPKICI